MWRGASLHEDDDGQRLALDFFDRDFLFDTVVCKAEISGFETVDEVARCGTDQRGDNEVCRSPDFRALLFETRSANLNCKADQNFLTQYC